MAEKRIGAGGEDASWNTDLLKQLGFIRRHLRYPVSRRTAAPAIMVASVLPAVGFLIYHSLTAKSASKQLWLPLLLVCMMLIPGIAVARRFFSTLRFVAVPARATLSENMTLLLGFLRHHHFAIGRHPEAPEVFRIISKNISQLRDEREVVIFIADDHRILVNSHFTQNRFRLAVGYPHYRQMAAMLADWIREQDAADNRTLRVRK
jgi:hypothetical protein